MAKSSVITAHLPCKAESCLKGLIPPTTGPCAILDLQIKIKANRLPLFLCQFFVVMVCFVYLKSFIFNPSHCGWLVFQCQDHVSQYILFCFQNFLGFCARYLAAVPPNILINCMSLGPVLKCVIS